MYVIGNLLAFSFLNYAFNGNWEQMEILGPSYWPLEFFSLQNVGKYFNPDHAGLLVQTSDGRCEIVHWIQLTDQLLFL